MVHDLRIKIRRKKIKNFSYLQKLVIVLHPFGQVTVNIPVGEQYPMSQDVEVPWPFLHPTNDWYLSLFKEQLIPIFFVEQSSLVAGGELQTVSEQPYWHVCW